MRKYLMLLPLPLLVAACGDPVTETVDPLPSETAIAAPEAEETEGVVAAQSLTVLDTGLRLNGVAGEDLTLDFGTAQTEALAALADVLGNPEMGVNEECGAGPVQFADYGALQLNFQDESLVGWAVDDTVSDVEITSETGLAVGDARAMVSANDGFEALEDSTLGEEFTITAGTPDATISGLFDDEGNVSDLWAGVVCNYR